MPYQLVLTCFLFINSMAKIRVLSSILLENRSAFFFKGEKSLPIAKVTSFHGFSLRVYFL